MILHTLIQATTLRYGGAKSPGKDIIDEPLTCEHLTAAELIKRLEELSEQGYTLDVHIDAHRDRRRADAKRLYPANPCPECNMARARQHVADMLRRLAK